MASIQASIAPPVAGHWSELRQWNALGFYNGIRISLGLAFLLVAVFAPPQPPWDAFKTLPMGAGILGYLLLALAWIRAIRLRRPALRLQLNSQLLIDIAVIVLVTRTTGLNTGIGALVLAPVTVAGLLLTRRFAVLFAALASLGLLGDQVYGQLFLFQPAAYTQAGILGALAFTSAVTANALARRARESEALAERRGQDIQSLSRLNEIVIQNMQSGIVVVSPERQIRLINTQARRMLLGSPEAWAVGRPLEELVPELAGLLNRWDLNPLNTIHSFRSADQSTEIIPYFSTLGGEGEFGTLIFLEDMALVNRRMQEMKLAALGRLSASIAHEIRNPLAAMSHAGQLLGESEGLRPEEVDLTRIIQSHGRRINSIVENVLQLSRQPASKAQLLDLWQWLPEFVESWQAEHGRPIELRLLLDPAATEVRIDPGHLQQILDNLLGNAREHGASPDGGVRVSIRSGLLGHGQRTYLDLQDDGPGIDPEVVEQIFEPFFTTRYGGTGLGLFISRELCEFNGANLGYLGQDNGGGRFRISFGDPNLWTM